jgi:predicted acyltransferase
MGLIKIPRADGTRPSLQGFIYTGAYASWLPPNKASLAYAISFILLWLFFMWLLYRKNIIIKI